MADLPQRIACIPEHLADLPAESASPIEHYKRSANDARNLVAYFTRQGARANVYRGPFERHLTRLRALAFLALVQSFERYLKEVAAVCIDQVGPLVLDDRLSAYAVPSRAIAAHFAEDDLGRALAEGQIWLDTDTINKRFRKLLADPFDDGAFWLFPHRPTPGADEDRRRAMDILWQLRHSVTHNVGVITRSDAAKLRLLRRGHVEAPRVLALTEPDLRDVKLFIDELVDTSNQAVADRLAELLTTIHTRDPTLFDAQQRADKLAEIMKTSVTISGNVSAPT